MPPARDLPDRELKDRHKQLYGGDSQVASGPRKAFATYLKETPAAPLSRTMKAVLIAVAVVVALAFLASLFKGLNSRPRSTIRPNLSANSSHSTQMSASMAKSEWLHA